MARIFITGSADGLGQLAAKALIEDGHSVWLHARNVERARQALNKLPKAEDALAADLSSIEETKALALKLNGLGTFDAVIHNAGVYQVPANSRTVDGLPLMFAVNSLAPYILTSLMHKPKRFVYLSSGMHLQGSSSLPSLKPNTPNSNVHITYSDTKLHDVILAMAVARKWKSVYANAVNPGWVPTKMGGAGAPDDLEAGYQTQVWLSVSTDAAAMVSGNYFHHKKITHCLPAAKDVIVQEKFLAQCQEITGLRFDAAE